MIYQVSLLILLSASIIDARGQTDYDADSVKYTPIAKPIYKLKVKHKSPVDTDKIQYFFNVQFGALVGCNDCGKGKDFTSTAATVHGVSIGKKLRMGLGLGFDSYLNWQTLPLFGQASWDLIGNRNKNALFLQMSYGWAHPWFEKGSQYSYYDIDPFQSVEGGRMINPQIGYRLKYYDLRLTFSLGYKYQNISYRIPGNCPYCDLLTTGSDVSREMNRFQMMMSVGWK